MTELTSKVLLRLTKAEHDRLKSEAVAADMSVNNYVRTQWLGGEPVASSTPTYNSFLTRVENLETRQTDFEMQIQAALQIGQSKLRKKS